MSEPSSRSAVDLSRLPAPTVVEQLSFEAIYAALLTDLQARLPDFTATVESDPVVKLLQVCAYRELIVRQNFNDRARGLMLAYAGAADLDHLAALVGVTRLELAPAQPLLGLAALMEADDDLRARVVLAPESFSVAGPELAYAFYARSADADVLDAGVSSPSPGEVVITILSRTDDGAASPELLDAVEAIVSARDVRPLTDHVTVASAAIVEFAVNATLYLYQGPDSSLVVTEARARVEAYIAANHRIGRDITLSGLYAALHVEGVQRVVIAQPLADLVIGTTQASWCTGITVAVGGNDD